MRTGKQIEGGVLGQPMRHEKRTAVVLLTITSGPNRSHPACAARVADSNMP